MLAALLYLLVATFRLLAGAAPVVLIVGVALCTLLPEKTSSATFDRVIDYTAGALRLIVWMLTLASYAIAIALTLAVFT